VLATTRHEWALLAASTPGPRAVGALIFLAVVGGWAGYGAFSWLTRNARPTLVATYGYVNPLVAVLLGWALGGEGLGSRTLLGGGLIVVSVALVTMLGSRVRR
jgi:drug/metabolite transporter (DMT)-like permease